MDLHHCHSCSVYELSLALAGLAAFYDLAWTPVAAFLAVSDEVVIGSWIGGLAADALWLFAVFWYSKAHRKQKSSRPLAMELLTCSPLEVIGFGTASGQPLLELRLLVKLLRLYRLDQILIYRYRDDVQADWNAVTIYRRLLLMLWSVHLYGLLWAWLGHHNGVASGWLLAYAEEDALEDLSIPRVYFRSVYWARSYCCSNLLIPSAT